MPVTACAAIPDPLSTSLDSPSEEYRVIGADSEFSRGVHLYIHNPREPRGDQGGTPAARSGARSQGRIENSAARWCTREGSEDDADPVSDSGNREAPAGANHGALRRRPSVVTGRAGWSSFVDASERKADDTKGCDVLRPGGPLVKKEKEPPLVKIPSGPSVAGMLSRGNRAPCAPLSAYRESAETAADCARRHRGGSFR